jgi:hypothetical protein
MDIYFVWNKLLKWNEIHTQSITTIFYFIVERDHWGELGVDGWIILACSITYSNGARMLKKNIRTDVQEVGCEYMDWTGLAQDRDS